MKLLNFDGSKHLKMNRKIFCLFLSLVCLLLSILCMQVMLKLFWSRHVKMSVSLKVFNVKKGSNPALDQGEALNILKFEKGKSVIGQKNLNKIFDHPDVKNRKIVAFSIIGAFRKGKSFFLNYCLRYMYANVSTKFLRHNLKIFIEFFCSTNR